MQVRLTGLHRVRARGRTYYYAWRGGPRLTTPPEDRRGFAAEFFRLTRGRPGAARDGTLAGLVASYKASPDYQRLRESTRRSYEAAIDTIEAEFFDLPLAAIEETGARRLFVEWRDGFAETPRKADLLVTVLARMIAFGVDREMIARNPLEKVGRLSDGTRRDIVWSDAQVEAFRAHAHPKLSLALELARWTGQRQADLLRVTWTAYDGTHLRLRQSKTGRWVRIRIYSELKALLDATPREAVTILTTTRRKPTPWTGDGFRASWAGACAAARIEGVTFHDLRGTFVTLAYRKGASIREIAEITGHAERDAEAIIRRHYLAGDAAIARLESPESENETGRKV